MNLKKLKELVKREDNNYYFITKEELLWKTLKDAISKAQYIFVKYERMKRFNVLTLDNLIRFKLV